MAASLADYADRVELSVRDYVDGVLSLHDAGEISIADTLLASPVQLIRHLAKHSYARQLTVSKSKSKTRRTSTGLSTGLRAFFDAYDSITKDEAIASNRYALLGLVVACRTLLHPTLLIEIDDVREFWKLNPAFLPDVSSYENAKAMPRPIDRNKKLERRWRTLTNALNRGFNSTSFV